MKRAYTIQSLAEDVWLPKDVRGYPNRSYLGHTSDIIPTPWPHEGQPVEGSQVRRIPIREFRTLEQEKERKRLAAIENPGRCQARMRRVDAWCRKFPINGLDVCFRHGGSFKHSRKAAAERYAEQVVNEQAEKIVKRARK